MKARKLTVLNLNDREVREFRSGVGKAKHFDLCKLASWKDVQQNVGGLSPCKPDILLIDIDFEDDRSISKTTFPGCGDAKPIGLLLALPYIASRAICELAIYSAHFVPETFDASPVLKSPWVLLPLGIIAAKREGIRRGDSEFSSSVLGGEGGGGKILEQYMLSIPRLQNPSQALDRAYNLYIVKLLDAVTARRLRVSNAENIRLTLDAAEAAALASGAKRIAIDDELYLELYGEGYGTDRIQWLSLCAGPVGFVHDDVDADGLKKIRSYLKDFAGADPVFQKALHVIREQDQLHDKAMNSGFRGEVPRERFDRVASRIYAVEDDAVRCEILRIGVLLANAHAWAVSSFSGGGAIEGTLKQLGVVSKKGNSYAGDQRTYAGWFKARTNGRNSRTVSRPMICGRTLRIRPLEKFKNDGVDRTESIFLKWGKSELDAIDKIRIRHFLELQQSEGYVTLPSSMPYLDVTA